MSFLFKKEIRNDISCKANFSLTFMRALIENYKKLHQKKSNIDTITCNTFTHNLCNEEISSGPSNRRDWPIEMSDLVMRIN